METNRTAAPLKMNNIPSTIARSDKNTGAAFLNRVIETDSELNV
jgi:hypothetical protein